MDIKNLKVFDKLNNIKKITKLKVAAVMLGGVMFLPTIGGCNSVKNSSSVNSSTEIEINVDNEETKIFQPSEHIIVKCDELGTGHWQVDNYEGYEIMNTEVSSKINRTYNVVYYVNTVPVLCKKTGEDFFGKSNYNDFGTPVEKNKTYTK